jgi:Ni/Co efflux regulator RcnB
MKIISKIWLIAFLAAALAVGMVAAPQGSSDKNKKQQSTKTDKDKSADKDADKTDKNKDQQKADDSGFGGTITAKGSKQTKDTATLGFKGVGPDGQVDSAKLGESPIGEDERIAQLMTGVKTNTDEAKVFVDNGKLKSQ